MSEQHPLHITADTPAPTSGGRRVSKKALGLLAAAAVSAGTIGSLTLMTNPSAAETPEITPIETEVTNILPRTIEDIMVPVEDIEPPVEPAELDQVEPWELDGHNWDACPACGMG